MGSKAVKDAINELGRYFGIRSADGYLSALLEGSAAGQIGTDIKKAREATNVLYPILAKDTTVAKVEARGALINAISAGGDTSTPTVQAMLEWCKANSDKSEGFRRDVCITPMDLSEASKVPDGPLNKFSVGDQGMGKPKASGIYSLADLFFAKDSEAAADTTKVSVIQVFPAVGNLSNSDTDVVSLFLNSVPTLEMSRAVPFLDILTLVEGGSYNDDTSTRQMSLARWMLGEDISGEAPEMREALNAEDASVAGSGFNKNTAAGPETAKPMMQTAATMEIFTSPQTMISGRPLLNNTRSGLENDPFRPFLSVESLKLETVGAGGMFAYKSGQLNLILHDKSKLGDIAPLIAPDQIARIRFVITYGWAHPDGTSNLGSFSQGMPRKADSDANRFGELIDAMKVCETFQVVNTRYDFEENGEVKIELQISLLGAGGLTRFEVTLAKVVEFASTLSAKFEGLNAALAKYKDQTTGTGKIALPEVLQQASNASSGMAMSTKEVKKIFAWTRYKKGKNSVVAEIDKMCRAIFGQSGRKNGLKAKADATKAAALASMISKLKTTPDPFLKPMGTFLTAGSFKKTRGNPNKTTVSLGKLLAVFVGESLGSTDQFDEVQLIFHAFNNSAAYAYNSNISQFPISISAVETLLKKKFDITGRMSISNFLNIISEYFLSDPAAPGFGFNKGKIYGGREKDNASARKLTAKGKRMKKAGTLHTYKKTILQAAYAPATDDTPGMIFKQPSLQARLDTYAARGGVLENPQNPALAGNTILKIQIFDQQCNTADTLYELFQGFAGTGIMGVMKRSGEVPGQPPNTRGARHGEVIVNQYNTLLTMDVIKKVTIDDAKCATGGDGMDATTLKSFAADRYMLTKTSLADIKRTITSMVPSLKWGSGTAGLQSAKLSTQNVPELIGVNILRQAGDEQDASKDGMPTAIMPTELTIEIMGCPYIAYGQLFFIDFGTNSTADNFYGVMGVNHDIEGGKFTTSVRLGQLETFGTFSTAYDDIIKLSLNAHIAKKKKA